MLRSALNRHFADSISAQVGKRLFSQCSALRLGSRSFKVSNEVKTKIGAVRERGTLALQSPIIQKRLFHISPISLAKKGKKHGKKSSQEATQHDDGQNEEEEVIEVNLPDLDAIKGKMDRSMDRFLRELSKLRVGRPSADMFNDLNVGSNGQLSYLAQVTMKNANTITISPYDPAMANTVAEAVRDCGLGLNPVVESNAVEVFIPKPSKESRQALLKSAARLAEKVRKDIHLAFNSHHAHICLSKLCQNCRYFHIINVLSIPSRSLKYVPSLTHSLMSVLLYYGFVSLIVSTWIGSVVQTRCTAYS